MKRELLLWNPCTHPLFLPSFSSLSLKISRSKQFPRLTIHASLDSAGTEQNLSAKERRQLRNEKRESKSGYSWREEVEERLSQKKKKKYLTLKEKLDLNTMANLGPQWWVVRTSRAKCIATAEILDELLKKNFPKLEYKIYMPLVQEKKRLKSGSLPKPKQLFPGSIFLRCVLNRQLHDFIRGIDGVAGFLGFKVGNAVQRIHKPKQISEQDMEAVFKRAKEEQEQADQAYMEALDSQKLMLKPGLEPDDASISNLDSKPTRNTRTRKPPILAVDKGKGVKRLSSGAKVRVVSGTFAEFEGILKKLNRKTKTATVLFTVFGKETLADLDVSDIVLETN